MRQCVVDGFRYLCGMFEDVGVPDADYAAAVLFEPACAGGVAVAAFFVGVWGAVELDDQFGLRAEEVGDEGADRGLAAEAEAGELFAAEELPELAFAFGHGAAEVAGLGFGHAWAVVSWLVIEGGAAPLPAAKAVLRTARPPSPTRGEG